MSDKLEDAPDDEILDDESELDEESTDEIEDEEEDSEEESSNDVIDLDGEEVTLEEIRAWKDGHLRQSDYTKKTMELADQRKATKALAETMNEKIASLDEQITVLEAAIEHGDGYSEEELEDLFEEDPRLFRKIEKQRKSREKVLEDARKQHKKALEERIPAEQQALIAAMPEWSDPKKGRETYDRDQKLVGAYMEELGFTQKEAEKMIDNRIMQAMIHAARYKNLKKSQPKKQVKKPVTTKPGTKKGTAQPKTFAQALYG